MLAHTQIQAAALAAVELCACRQQQCTGFRLSRKHSPHGCTNVSSGLHGSLVTVGNKTRFYREGDSTTLIAQGLKGTQSIFKSIYSKLHRAILHLTFISAPFMWQEGLFLQSLIECSRYTVLIMSQGDAWTLDIPLCFLPN